MSKNSMLAYIVDNACADLQDSLRPKHSARAALEAAVNAAYDKGIKYALESEAKAWHRVTVLEDAITEIVRHAPGSAMAKAKALAKEIEQAEV